MALYTLETHGNLEPHLGQEWLLTNGKGAYAASSVVGCNTRKYHGLLVAATLPPVGRIMALNRVGEILTVDGQDDRLLELSVNQFGGQNFHPQGYRYLRTFEHHGATVKWTYDVEGVVVEKELQLVWGQNRIAVRYTVDPGARKAKLRLIPFVSLRDFHATLKASGVSYDVRTGIGPEARISVARTGHEVVIEAPGGQVETRNDWWYGHTYRIESHRGQDDTEDLFCPGNFLFAINGKTTVTLWASVAVATPVAGWEASLKLRPDEVAAAAKALKQAMPSVTLRRLLHAANDFVVDRRNPDGSPGKTVIAGYPWFADWGRDTMIALPGLLLTPGRYDDARNVLAVFAKYVSQGMIPNKFDDYTNEPSYNTVDASLWFVHAVFEYVRLSGDKETFERELKPACREIIDGYRRGTRYRIHMDERDGLITQGDENTQLTWMDARCGGISFTPRQGKAVEINALWYHALVLMGEKELAARVAESFRKTFWISPFRGLADVVSDDGQRDVAIRPNQIFAASLPNSPLTDEQRSAVVEVVRRELLTPVGLHSLARSDPKYHSIYAGEQFKRDEAYHNGTIWSWLIGAFLDAYLRVNDRSAASVEQARKWLDPLVRHMELDACVGSISEIFEANPPHRAEGTFAQAWSVAEALRLAVELGM